MYMGIDVFGRGTYGGGQLNTNVAAAAAIREGVLCLIPASSSCCSCTLLIHTASLQAQPVLQKWIQRA